MASLFKTITQATRFAGKVGNHASVRSFHVTRAIFGDKSFEKTFNTLLQVKQTTQSSYNAIIRVYADKEKFEDALNIYERLKGYNIQNYSTYHSMIEALQKNKDVKGTVKVLTDLVDDDILWRNASNSFGEKTNLVNLLHKTMKWIVENKHSLKRDSTQWTHDVLYLQKKTTERIWNASMF